MIKRFIYFLLDFITLGNGQKVVINNFSLRLPIRFTRYYPNDYEQDNFSFLRNHCKDGMTSIDVGGQFGLMATYIQSLTNGIVYSFEPTPSTYDVLCQTVKINGLQNKIVPIKAAVSDKNGTITFYTGDQTGDASNSLVNYQNSSKQQNAYQVDCVSIDAFVQERNIPVIDLIKIDAEGAELSVLMGAKHVFNNHRPIGVLALHPASIKLFGDSLEEIWNCMKSYQMTLFFNGIEITKQDFCSRTDLFDVTFMTKK